VSEWSVVYRQVSENTSHFDEMMMISTLYWMNTLNMKFYSASSLKNSPRVDMSLHSDILFRFPSNQSLLLLLNAAYLLAEQHQIQII